MVDRIHWDCSKLIIDSLALTARYLLPPLAFPHRSDGLAGMRNLRGQSVEPRRTPALIHAWMVSVETLRYFAAALTV